VPTEKFSFFVTSLKALLDLSGSPDGFGGDLRYGETGPGAGLRGADKICGIIADRSMPNASLKGWHAFLSTSTVNAIDRIGEGPWYDRLGRLVAANKADLLGDTRPVGADSVISNDLPNEDGVPNHEPDVGQGQVDNHDTLTGSDADGKLYAADAACKDWETTDGPSGGRPRVGHSWGRGNPIGPGDINSWVSSLDESGCKPGINLIETGPPDPEAQTVGSGGGYGGWYCFALTP
jgi:hypothetical protein